MAASRRSSSGTSRPTRPSAARRGGPRPRASCRTSQRTVVGTGSSRSTSRSPAPPSTVALPAEPDEEPRRDLAQRRERQLAEPAARRDERVALVASEQRQPDRRGRLDHCAAVGQDEPARRTRPPERVGDDASRHSRRAPRGAPRPFPRRRRRPAARPPRRRRREPPRERGRRRARREDALEASGTQQRPHGPPRRRSRASSSSSIHLVHALDRVLGRLLVVLHAPEHRERDALARDRDQPSPTPHAISIACSTSP